MAALDTLFDHPAPGGLASAGWRHPVSPIFHRDAPALGGAATRPADGYRLTLDPDGRHELLAVLACGIGWYDHAAAGDVQVRMF